MDDNYTNMAPVGVASNHMAPNNNIATNNNMARTGVSNTHMASNSNMAPGAVTAQGLPRMSRIPSVHTCNRHIMIKWHGHVLVDCPPGQSLVCYQANHAPTYFIPPMQVKFPISTTNRPSYCEFRGNETLYSLMNPIDAGNTVHNRIMSYLEPKQGYESLKGYIAFYCGPWECFVDNERAFPPPEDHPGWVTSEFEGLFNVNRQWGHHWNMQ